MAYVTQTTARSELRIGHLRLQKPEAMLSLTSIAIDPDVSAHCANEGTEQLSWLLRIERNSLTTGSAHPSVDGKTFVFANDSVGTSECDGFVAKPVPIAPVTVAAAHLDNAFVAMVPALNIANYKAGHAWPLREVRIEVSDTTNPSCVGRWNPKWWCDGDSLGWTDGGRMTAKLALEDADRIILKSAGCQSLCAILVNDALKTEGKVCKRGPDGKIPEYGDACIGGTSCKNAFELVATFSAYGVDIVP
jgi:hypothetical protein